MKSQQNRIELVTRPDLNQGQSPEIDGVDDAKELGATIDAFNMLGFSAKEQKNIFLILAGILHLGQSFWTPSSLPSRTNLAQIPVPET